MEFNTLYLTTFPSELVSNQATVPETKVKLWKIRRFHVEQGVATKGQVSILRLFFDLQVLSCEMYTTSQVSNCLVNSEQMP